MVETADYQRFAPCYGPCGVKVPLVPNIPAGLTSEFSPESFYGLVSGDGSILVVAQIKLWLAPVGKFSKIPGESPPRSL